MGEPQAEPGAGDPETEPDAGAERQAVRRSRRPGRDSEAPAASLWEAVGATELYSGPGHAGHGMSVRPGQCSAISKVPGALFA